MISGMRSLPIRNVAGQHNLKGKLHKALDCGCCVLHNLKPAYEKNRQLKEIRTFDMSDKE